MAERSISVFPADDGVIIRDGARVTLCGVRVSDIVGVNQRRATEGTTPGGAASPVFDLGFGPSTGVVSAELLGWPSE